MARPGQGAAIDATRLAAAIGPAVVNINTRLDALEGGGRAAGTGMIISRTGQATPERQGARFGGVRMGSAPRPETGKLPPGPAGASA